MKKILLKYSQKGFTIIELIVYMGILSILLLTLTALFNASLDAHLEAQSTSGITQDGQFILDRLSYDINRADSVTVPNNLGINSSTLAIVINGTTYTYSLNSGNLILNYNSANYQINSYSTSINNLAFTRYGNTTLTPPDTVTTLKIEYTVASRINTNSGYESRNYSTVIGLK